MIPIVLIREGMRDETANRKHAPRPPPRPIAAKSSAAEDVPERMRRFVEAASVHLLKRRRTAYTFPFSHQIV